MLQLWIMAASMRYQYGDRSIPRVVGYLEQVGYVGYVEREQILTGLGFVGKRSKINLVINLGYLETIDPKPPKLHEAESAV
eukprot:1801435-Pyramimonas_sp.AAC.2